MQLTNHPLIQKLYSLNLPINDYAVFGSGPMFAHGIRPSTDLDDLDIIARGKAWEIFKTSGKMVSKKERDWGKQTIDLFDGKFEVFNEWGPGSYDLNQLIDNAELMFGIPFVKLDEVLRWKREMGREKDKEHVRLIEKYKRAFALNQK